MFKEYFILLLMGHIVGDFYFQSGNMAAKKEKGLRWVMIHCACYWAVMLIILMIYGASVKFANIAALFHLIIDASKFFYLSSSKKRRGKMMQTEDRNIFFADQLLHFAALIVVAFWAAQSDIQIMKCEILDTFFDVVGISENLVVSWMFVLLVIHKPSNIAIQKLLAVYKPADEDDVKEINAGRFIGTLERVIMIIFLSIEQYSAIGLVLTAKSIARYDKITREKDFAEYYLLGTLLSTVSAIIISFAL